jgi:hypothetical protein
MHGMPTAWKMVKKPKKVCQISARQLGNRVARWYIFIPKILFLNILEGF